MYTLLFSTPSIRAIFDASKDREAFPTIGHWVGIAEASDTRTFADFADAVDYAVKLCQDQGEQCVLLLSHDAGTREVYAWEAPFSSYMDAARALRDCQAWTWTRDTEGLHGHASIIGPYPRRLDAHKGAKVSKVYAAFVNSHADISELSTRQHSEVEL